MCQPLRSLLTFDCWSTKCRALPVLSDHSFMIGWLAALTNGMHTAYALALHAVPFPEALHCADCSLHCDLCTHLAWCPAAVHPSFLVKEHSVKEMPKSKVTRRASKGRLGVAKRSGVKKATSKKLNSIAPLLEKKVGLRYSCCICSDCCCTEICWSHRCGCMHSRCLCIAHVPWAGA